MSWLLVPLAFLAMACQDVVCVVMVRAETSGRAHLAAAGDVLQDALGLASLGAVGGSLLAGHGALLAAAVVAARLAGDYAGTWCGVKAGVWLDRRRRPAPVEISWQCSPGADQQLIESLKRSIRRNGGSPGAGVLR